MASAALLTVLVGFTPTFYMRGFFAQHRPISMLLIVHGAVFSAWIAAFLTQTILMARGSQRLHRRLGWIAVGLAAAMICLVTGAVIEQLRRVNGFPPPPLALALSAFDLVVFATLVGGAIYCRGQSDWHKRLMLAATIVLLGAPMFRLVVHVVGVTDMGKAGILSALLVDAFFVPCIANDLVTRRRIHPAYLLAFSLIVLDQVAQDKVVSWQPWIDLSLALQRLVT